MSVELEKNLSLGDDDVVTVSDDEHSDDENDPEYETVIEEIHFFIYTVKYHYILSTGKTKRSWSNINCRRNRIRIVSIEDGAIIRK